MKHTTADYTDIHIINRNKYFWTPHLGGISPNDFWVLEISCVLAPPQNFRARAHLMLPKINVVIR